MSTPGSPIKFWNNRSIKFQKRQIGRPSASPTQRAFLMALRDPRPGVALEDKLRAAAAIIQEEAARDSRT